ncbi:hypothetical protein [Sneathia sanguinegens]|uniref:hypothetical protein n=1 Tax=Sneathia sanguinegens TaxID=40543 RepID=UPI00288A9ED5|nr:hypothetical protein [Sneathia sanguinegens]
MANESNYFPRRSFHFKNYKVILSGRGSQEKAIYYMQTIGRNYPDCGYGLNFFDWIFYNPKPYNSFGNGAAMRISAVGFLSKDLE